MCSKLTEAASVLSDNSVILESTITCPECGYAEPEIMPTDACLFFYQCMSCKTLLKPKSGDCCVFCSYGSVTCPPMQQGKVCIEAKGEDKLVIQSK
ncbi:GDCCVxC domain-containing (seleno)protein [Methylomicrobium lacus]|uniref:GDCCVxC domain-containing (seleno)protein n=1 Tax=Methylomicrobium lacus TaxID=136992 RepID=UPI0009FEF9A0|nr:GDCCVxC domain-containing (seleno)protein [Methylomicrobium lacus]